MNFHFDHKIILKFKVFKCPLNVYGTFSSKFANVQSGQHYCEGKMSIPGKHFGGQNPVLNTKGTRAKRDMLSCRKRLSLKCSWLNLKNPQLNGILIFLLITKTAFHRRQLSQDNRVKNEKLKRKRKTICHIGKQGFCYIT